MIYAIQSYKTNSPYFGNAKFTKGARILVKRRGETLYVETWLNKSFKYLKSILKSH